MVLESWKLPPLGERIRAGQADPISPLEVEICDRIKAKYEARYGAEKTAQLASPRWEIETRDRIKERFTALYGAQRARELAVDQWEDSSADAQPRSHAKR